VEHHPEARADKGRVIDLYHLEVPLVLGGHAVCKELQRLHALVLGLVAEGVALDEQRVVHAVLIADGVQWHLDDHQALGIGVHDAAWHEVEARLVDHVGIAIVYEGCIVHEVDAVACWAEVRGQDSDEACILAVVVEGRAERLQVVPHDSCAAGIHCDAIGCCLV
jgi:hypothetical protein